MKRDRPFVFALIWTNRAFLAATPRLVVVADRTKWGVVGLCGIANLGEAETLVADDRMPNESRRALSESVDDVVFAAVSQAEATSAS